MTNLNLKDDETFVEGRSAETARDLLEKAEAAGIDASRIRTTFRGYIVPKELGGEDVGTLDNTIAPNHQTAKEGETTALTQKGIPTGESTEESGQFDPSKHTVAEVEEYLATADADEYDRVIAAEREGKSRQGVLSLADTEEK